MNGFDKGVSPTFVVFHSPSCTGFGVGLDRSFFYGRGAFIRGARPAHWWLSSLHLNMPWGCLPRLAMCV